MNIRINKAHFPVTVLGPGRRLGIWLQGCSIRCPGCLSRDTWAPHGGSAMAVDALLDWCRATCGEALDGVTLSGGEPFDQAPALAALLDGLDAWRAESGKEFDLLCYSGHPLRTLQKRFPELLARLDAVIAEPFVDGLAQTRLWRGSGNQSLQPLSPLGHARYAPYLDATADSQGKRLQMQVDQGRVWYVGIPARGDLDALAALCRERGLEFRDMSWKP